MSGTAVFNAQLDRFDALIDAPEPYLPLGGFGLRRIKGVLLLAVAVTQAWLLHGMYLIRRRLARRRPDAGMTTAEYAVGTVAACGFAALTYPQSRLLTWRSRCTSLAPSPCASGGTSESPMTKPGRNAA